MREKKVRKRSRKQRALHCLKWITILVVFNVVFYGLPYFMFQARNTMEIQYDLDSTHVVWEEKAKWGRWDGNFHGLSADETTAIFYNRHFTIEGWTSGVVQLLDINTTEPLSAAWSGSYERGRHETIWAMGCVASAQVSCVEYCLIWDNERVEMYPILEEDFIQDNGNRYYVYDTGACFFEEDPETGDIFSMISEILVTARDKDGQILHQEYLYPSWK